MPRRSDQVDEIQVLIKTLRMRLKKMDTLCAALRFKQDELYAPLVAACEERERIGRLLTDAILLEYELMTGDLIGYDVWQEEKFTRPNGSGND